MSDNEVTLAITELTVAQDCLVQASAEVQRARADETTCVNRVNQAQKKLDELIAAMKKRAPRGSDWHQAAQLRHPVAG